MENLRLLYTYLDLAGTFVFAISGAIAARQRGLDLFGITVIAFIVACGGGIMRDISLGAVPPAGLSNWYYLALTIVAAATTVGLYRLVEKMKRPVIFFDTIGLSMFAVTGAEKALSYGHNAQVAVLLGTLTAVGGGVLRDVILNRVPIILEKEIYALAALMGALVVVLGNYFKWVSADFTSIVALLTCFIIRILALRFHWNLPATKT